MIAETVLLAGAFYGVKRIQDGIIKTGFEKPCSPITGVSEEQIRAAQLRINKKLLELNTVDVEFEEIREDDTPPQPSTPSFTRETVKEWVNSKIKEGKLTIDEMAMGESVFNPERVISIKDIMIFADVGVSEDEWVILLDYMVSNSDGGMIPVGGLNFKVAPHVVEQVAANMADPAHATESTAELWEKFGEDTDKIIFANLELGKVMGNEAMSVDHIKAVGDCITIDEESRQAVLPITNVEYPIGEIPKGVVMYVAERMEMKSVGWVDRTRSPMLFFFNPTQAEEATTHKPKKEKGPNPKRVEFPGRENKQNQPQVRTKG